MVTTWVHLSKKAMKLSLSKVPWAASEGYVWPTVLFWWSGRPQHHPLTFSSVKRQSLGVEIERDGGGQRGRGHLCPSSQGFCIRFWSLIVHPKGPKHTFSPPKALYWQQVHHNLHILFQLWGFLGLVS